MAEITIDLPDNLCDEIRLFLQDTNSEMTIEEYIVKVIEHEMEKQQKITELVNNFKNQTEIWTQHCPNEYFIFNEDLLDPSINWANIKYIIVGDNPGKMELDKKRYLVFEDQSTGASGPIAKKLFEYLKLEKNKDYIVLNKCPIFSEKTDKLKGKCLLKETQEYMAELIFELHELLGSDCKVYIFGFGGTCENGEWQKYTNNDKKNKTYKKGDYKGTMSSFFEKLKELYDTNSELKKLLYIAKHFSGNHIFEDLVSKIKPDILFKALVSLEYKDKLFEQPVHQTVEHDTTAQNRTS